MPVRQAPQQNRGVTYPWEVSADAAPDAFDGGYIYESVAAAQDSGSGPAVQQTPRPVSSGAAAVAAGSSSATIHATVATPAAPRKSRKLLAVIAALVLIAVLIGGGLYFHSRRSNGLTEKDTVVLADFVNTTGDSVFDGTLKQALAVQLEQSPYLNLLPESRIREALRFMGRPADTRLSNDVAREICMRDGAKAMLTGSIASLGTHYVITLSALNAQTGDVLAREEVEAENKEQVLKSLDRAASSLRGKLGESIGSVQKFTTPLEQATMPSAAKVNGISRINSTARAERQPLRYAAIAGFGGKVIAKRP